MNIDFIKWMCEKAEGFEVMHGPKRGNISYKIGDWIPTDSDLFDDVYYPLFLQKAIEGVDNFSYFNNAYYEIEQHRWGIELFDHRLPVPKNHVDYWRYESDGAKSYLTDQAKESALKYIYEQDTKK